MCHRPPVSCILPLHPVSQYLLGFQSQGIVYIRCGHAVNLVSPLHPSIYTSADRHQLSLKNMYGNVFLCTAAFSHVLPSFILDSMRTVKLQVQPIPSCEMQTAGLSADLLAIVSPGSSGTTTL